MTEQWMADEAYIMEGTGIICTISGRSYQKVNEGKALVAAFYHSGGFTCPLLVSTEPNVVTYSALGQTFAYIGTLEYMGLTWYVSDTEYAMGGNTTPSGFAKKLSGSYAGSLAAGQALLETASVTVPEESLFLFRADGIFYDNDLNVLEIEEVTDEIMQRYGCREITADLTGFESITIYKYDENEQRSDLTVTVEAVPPPQTVWTGAINISDSSITGIESVTVEYKGTPLFALSFDGGGSWKMHNGTEWVMLSEGNSGMQAETFMGITSEQWQEQINNTDTIFVRFTMESMEDAVESVLIDFTN